MRNKTTSFDIAYQAGVSQSTVSRALSGNPLVSKETRARIQAIAKELNYKVDKNASNLRTQTSNTIALLLFEDVTVDDSNINPFFLSMLGSITKACAEAKYDLLVSFQQMNDDWYAEYEDCHKADGLILLGYGDYLTYAQKLAHLIDQKTHFVLWGAGDKSLDAITIRCDNKQGGFAITQHLIEQGRRHIAFIGEASDATPELLERYQGYCQALKDNGLTPNKKLHVDAKITELSGYEATKELLARNEKVDAIFTACDLMAIGAMRAIKDKQLVVGKDIAVVGYDDISVAQFTNPPLTTVRQDTNIAGQLLVKNLIDLIKGNDVSNSIIEPRLMIRQSCGKA
ncbi:LacI family transcriptional regulator [Psychrosphaera saromensis]|uniref:LacI family transcriptional regulator n=1 Tax=Psychrosphaera saromensis TaxID=716813 RepID=A0A2S7UXR1_9GAMM|nr:LacI family DNA-binding transcriptional regulator [Psychrosphaera saromensis]PQJ54559.1 LacI family transcriptional regulator [Psychrosphaera saromensis]GHB58945.1 LacI family transcriptional regulator [Psychrosphaera saromensis]GLQ14229.1 LacI family transcriptional regulator [Psychrosphaera saromensis]